MGAERRCVNGTYTTSAKGVTVVHFNSSLVFADTLLTTHDGGPACLQDVWQEHAALFGSVVLVLPGHLFFLGLRRGLAVTALGRSRFLPGFQRP